jgi:hypothetical protein
MRRSSASQHASLAFSDSSERWANLRASEGRRSSLSVRTRSRGASQRTFSNSKLTGQYLRGMSDPSLVSLFADPLSGLGTAVAQSGSIRAQSVQVRWTFTYAWYADSSLSCASIVSTWGRRSTVYWSIALSQFSRSLAHLRQRLIAVPSLQQATAFPLFLARLPLSNLGTDVPP